MELEDNIETDERDLCSFEDMIEYLRIGSNVSRVEWEEKEFIGLINGDVCVNEDYANKYTVTVDDLVANDWYIVL